jgi:hypothetical protein
MDHLAANTAACHLMLHAKEMFHSLLVEFTTLKTRIRVHQFLAYYVDTIQINTEPIIFHVAPSAIQRVLLAFRTASTGARLG